MKKLLSIAIAAMTASLLADTITWTGEASTSDWDTAGNWNLNKEPAETDDVVIDGAAVTANGNRRIPHSLTLLNGASYSIGGEIQFGNTDVVEPVIYGGTVSGTLVASQYANSSLTISDAAIVDTGTGNNGFWQNGSSYLNFVDGSSRAASFTYNSSLTPGTDPWWFFCHDKNGTLTSSAPCIRYNGLVIDAATYADNFTSVQNGDGTVTLSMKSVSGWRVGPVSNGAIEDNDDQTLTKKTTLSVTVTKKGGNSLATVKIGWASQDYGDDVSHWPQGSLSMLTDVLSATDTLDLEVSFAPGVYYARAFVTYEENSQKTTYASDSHVVVARTHDYGGLDDVYEWIGTDNNLSSAENWEYTSGGVSSTPTNAPVAGTDLRWFGEGTSYSSSNFDAYPTDRYVGASLAVSGDFNVYGDVAFSNCTVSVGMFVMQEVNDSRQHVFTLYGTSLASSRTDAGWIGLYPVANYTAFNILPGKAASISGKVPNAVTAENVYSQLVDTEYVVMDGAKITSEEWDLYFTATVEGGILTISYSPASAENKFGPVTVTTTSSSATLSAAIAAAEEGADVYFAFAEGSVPPSDATLVEAANRLGSASTSPAVASPTGLTDLATYSFVFGIVKDGQVKASVNGVFLASDFDYVYVNGAWAAGRSPTTTDSADSILILDDYSTPGDDWQVANKVVSKAALTTGTLKGQGPIVLYSAQLSNGRNNDYANCPYGYWEVVAPFIDFRTASTNGTVYPAGSYSFYTAKSNAEIEEALFHGMILTNGAAVASGEFEIVENSSEEVGEDVTLRNVSLVYSEPFPTATGAWTVQPGARVKLAKNSRVGQLTVADSTGVKINLNGFKLTVAALYVDGEKKSGEFTASNLSILSGEGSLVVGGRGLSLFIR